MKLNTKAKAGRLSANTRSQIRSRAGHCLEIRPDTLLRTTRAAALIDLTGPFFQSLGGFSHRFPI